MPQVTGRFGGRDGRKGSAIVEAAFMMPWIAFLFVGILDCGFYFHAAMATQNAARAVAIQTAGGAATNACQAAKNEMGMLTNVANMGACAASQAAVSDAAPIWVCSGILTNTSASVCGQPAAICADCPLDNTSTSIQAVVTYRSIPLIPIPGILPLRLQLTRIAEASVIQ